VDFETVVLAILFLLIAVLYAAVGQARATGYLAAMALFHQAPATMKIAALALNLVVAAIGTFQFWRSGRLSLRAFYPFGVLGIPFSLAGGAVQLPSHDYYPLAGAILLLSGLQMVRTAVRQETFILKGGEVRQFRVLPNLDALRVFGITLDQLDKALAQFGVNTGGGFSDQHASEFLIRNLARTLRLEDLSDLVVATPNGMPVRLSQLAEVSFSAKPKRGDAGYMGKPAVIVSVEKQPDITRSS
jgi:hypothetical protein